MINNVVLVSDVQQSESVIYIYIYIYTHLLSFVFPPHLGHHRALSRVSSAIEWVLIELSFPGEGNGNPLQCSCLENSVDRGAWWAAVHGVAKS